VGRLNDLRGKSRGVMFEWIGDDSLALLRGVVRRRDKLIAPLWVTEVPTSGCMRHKINTRSILF
jgi:hypothetical protein